MTLAGTGAVISMLVTSWFNWKYDRRFGKEMKESLETPKGNEPLGEVKLAELKEEMANGAAKRSLKKKSGRR
jgi:hypothetical protein